MRALGRARRAGIVVERISSGGSRVLARREPPELMRLAVKHANAPAAPTTAPASWSTSTLRKLGRVPDGGGWRAHGRGSAPALAADRATTRSRRTGRIAGGYRYLHHAVDDHSRLVYSEILADQTTQTAADRFHNLTGNYT